MQCYVSKRRSIGLLLLCAALVATSYFCTTIPKLEAQIAGWAGSVFFGMGVPVLCIQLFRTGPQISIDSSGITHHRWKMGIIRWNEIDRVWVGSVRSARFLCVKLKDPTVFTERLPVHARKMATLNAGLGFGDLTLGFQGFSPGLKEVWNYLETAHPDKIGAEPVF